MLSPETVDEKTSIGCDKATEAVIGPEQEKLIAELFSALHSNKPVERLTKIITTKEFDINLPLYQGNTLLHYVVDRNLKALIPLLLEKGADPNIKNALGSNPIYYFIRKKFTDEEFLALIKNADINQVFPGGNTLLHLAAQKRPSLLEPLLKHKADPNLRNAKNETPVHCLVRTPFHSEDLITLIDNGVSIHLTLDKQCNTLLHLAAERRQDLIPSLLKAGANPLLKNLQERTALDILIDSKPKNEIVLALVKVMLEKGMDINSPIDNNGNTLIHMIAKKKPALIDGLVELGASLFVQNKLGQYPSKPKQSFFSTFRNMIFATGIQTTTGIVEKHQSAVDEIYEL